MKLRQNRLLAITRPGIAMEEDVQDGKLFRERERVIYARLKDVASLQEATSADSQEQWMIRLSKTEKNAAKGQIRVRKVLSMAKGENGYEVSKGDAQYVMTVKAERAADDRLEVPTPVTKDMFDLFCLLADNGMVKHRFHFPVEGSELVFEVDAFLKEDGSYHEWVKIDLELKDISVDVPELPFEVVEQIFDKTEDEAEKKKIWNLYETIFLAPNAAKAKVEGTIAQEGIVDWIKDKLTGSFNSNDVASVRAVIELLAKASSISDLRPFKAGTETNVVRFLLKDQGIISNVPAEVKRDAEQFKRFVTAVHELNTALKKIKLEDKSSDVITALKTLRESTLMRLDKTMWLGGRQVRFHKQRARTDVDRSWDREITEPGTAEEHDSMEDFVIDVLTYVAAREKYLENIEKLNKLLITTDLGEFKKAAGSLERELNALLEELVEFIKQAERLKSHSVGEVRKSLRFGHRLTSAALLVTNGYKDFLRHIA